MSQIVVATHDGVFHSDEVFAVALLQIFFGCYLKVVRTRDPQVIEAAHIVIDVGGVHAPEKGRFDHHFAPQPQTEDGRLLSSFGLVWEKYKTLGIFDEIQHIQSEIQPIVEEIDAWDNGARPTERGWTTLGAVIASLNSTDIHGPVQERQFRKAVDIAQEILVAAIRRARKEEEYESAIIRAYTIPNGTVVMSQFVPRWQERLAARYPGFVGAVWPHGDGTYRVAVARDYIIEEGHDSLWSFRHPAGFIAGTENLEKARLLSCYIVPK